MNRHKRLARHKRLTSSTPLSPNGPLQRGHARLERRQQMRQVSTRRQAENRERSKVLARLVEQRGPWCEIRLDICTGRWQDGHEVLRRSQGGSITDPENITLACRACHEWVTTHPKEAVALGWQRWRWRRS